VHDVCCLFCGRDLVNYRTHVEPRARELGVSDRVIWLGQLPDSDMAQLLAACDLYVQPSRVETGPLIVLEAMALGVPVVGTKCGSMPDFILPGVTGDLVPVCDPPALSRALAQALQDRPQLARMGAEARDRYRAHFSTAAVFADIEATLKEAAGLGRSRRWRRYASMAQPMHERGC
jgi:type III pantothenate kinase